MALIPPKFKPTPFEAVLTAVKELTSNVFEFHFKVDNEAPFHFEAGQFVNLNIPNAEKRVVRSYSIASMPRQDGAFELCIKLLDGPGSNFLRSLNAGDKCSFSGPFGIFSMKDEYFTEDMIFVGTGTGVAPLKSMIEYALKGGASKKLYLVFGVRNEADVIYTQEFEELKKSYPNFDYSVAISQPSEGFSGFKGRVTDFLISQYGTASIVMPALNNAEIFLCGNGQMITDVAKFFEEKGVASEKVKHEKFF